MNAMRQPNEVVAEFSRRTGIRDGRVDAYVQNEARHRDQFGASADCHVLNLDDGRNFWRGMDTGTTINSTASSDRITRYGYRSDPDNPGGPWIAPSGRTHTPGITVCPPLFAGLSQMVAGMCMVARNRAFERFHRGSFGPLSIPRYTPNYVPEPIIPELPERTPEPEPGYRQEPMVVMMDEPFADDSWKIDEQDLVTAGVAEGGADE